MSSIIQVKMEELNALPATKIVENEGVQAKFIQMYNAIWGTDKGEQMYHKEVFNFQKLLRDNPDVATSSKMSLYGCFLDIAVNGLTLDQTGHPLCYILSRNCKTGYKNEHGNDIYENVHTFRLPATVNLPCVCVPAKLNMLTTPSLFMRETISRHL